MSEVMKTCEIVEYNPTAAALAELKQRIGQKVYDVTSKAGMTVALADRREVRTIRVNLERIRKELKEPALRRCQQIDGEARVLTAQLEAIESVPDTAIKAEEVRIAAEKAEAERAELARVEQIHEAIRSLETLPMTAIGKAADEIAAMVSRLAVNYRDYKFDEFAPMARVAYDATVAKLEQMRKDAVAAAEEQAKIDAEREKVEAEARAVAAQKAAVEAEQRAVAEAQEAERQRIAQEREAVEAQKAEIAAAQVQPTSHAPFAEVGTDIHEDMARIFQVAIDYINQNDPTLPDCITMDEIANIAHRWIED